MKKNIMRYFAEVMFLIGADYRRKFKRQSIAKGFVVIALLGLTIVFAALSVHSGVFKIGMNDAVEMHGVLSVLGGVLLFMIIAIGLAILVTGGMILIPFFEIFFYISEKYGKKQHVINVFLFVLCTVFVLYTLNLVNVYEHLSGEICHGEIYNGMTTNYGSLFTFIFGVITIFVSFGIFAWLSGISKAWTHAVKQIIAMEKAKIQSLRQKDPEEYFRIRLHQSKEKPLDESEQLEMFDWFEKKARSIEEYSERIETCIVCYHPKLCEKALLRLFGLPMAAEVFCLYIEDYPLPPKIQMRVYEMPEKDAKYVILFHKDRFPLCDEAEQKLKALGWKYESGIKNAK